MEHSEQVIVKVLRDECRKRHKRDLIWTGPAIVAAAERCGVTWQRVEEVVNRFHDERVETEDA